MIRGWVFCLLWMGGTAIASPLFTTTSSIWDEKTKLLVGNCTVESPRCQTVTLKDEWGEESKWLDLVVVEAPRTKSFDLLKGYQGFKLKSKGRTPRIFGLRAGGDTKKGALYLIEGKTHSDLAHFELPFAIATGTLTLSDAYYANDWHTVLVVVAKDRVEKKSLVLVFDITDPAKSLEPFVNYVTDKLLVGIGRPAVVRLSDGRFGVGVVGSFLNKGALQIILFDEPKDFSRWFPVGGKGLSFLTAVDPTQQGFVDRIYLVGEAQLWVLHIMPLSLARVEKLADAEILSPPIVIQDAEGKGVRIYFLGHALKTKGLFMAQDPLQQAGKENTIKPIVEGDFGGFFVRFGHFLLVPQDLRLKIQVIDLPYHRPVPIEWETIYSSPNNNSSAFERLIMTKLIWDPKDENEILLTLNSSCQLKILAVHLPNSKYGRILWRKIQE